LYLLKELKGIDKILLVMFHIPPIYVLFVLLPLFLTIHTVSREIQHGVINFTEKDWQGEEEENEVKEACIQKST